MPPILATRKSTARAATTILKVYVASYATAVLICSQKPEDPEFRLKVAQIATLLKLPTSSKRLPDDCPVMSVHVLANKGKARRF